MLNMLASFWYVIPLIILAALLKSPWFKGVMGEFWVNLMTRLFLNKNTYHLIKNVTLPTEDGTTQIDHIIVSQFGVFVVETKNMKGWIYGAEDQKQWTQVIFKVKNKFQNPLHQNYKHTKVLADLLGLQEGQMHSVVVFVGDSTFKSEVPTNVTYGGGYIRHVKSFQDRVLSDEEVAEVISKIEEGRLERSFKTNREHVKHVKEIVAEKMSQTQCAKCGSPMVERVAKKGENAGNRFMGCSAYPKCRNTVAIG